MNKILNSFLISFFFILISTSSFSGGDDISVLQEELDMILIEDPCFNQLESDIDDEGNITSVMLIKGDGSFTQGDEIMSSSNVKAIVESYDLSVQKKRSTVPRLTCLKTSAILNQSALLKRSCAPTHKVSWRPTLNTGWASLTMSRVVTNRQRVRLTKCVLIMPTVPKPVTQP